MIVKNAPSKKRKVIGFVLIIAWVAFVYIGGVYIYNTYINKKPETVQGIVTTGTDENKVDETPVTDKDKDDWKVPTLHPRYISIPKLGINNARVVQLNIGASGQLQAPISIYDAGWYIKSSIPGNGKGAMLMDGHNGGPNYGGIFEKLNQLKAGDEIIIERGDGNKFTYEVRDIRDMLVKDINDPNNKFGMSTMLDSIDSSKEGLNIITCVGEWNASSQTFNSRTMLRAVRK